MSVPADCFDNNLQVDGCKDIDVKIIYKLCDKDEVLDFALNIKHTNLSFNNVVINDVLGVQNGTPIPADECHTYSYETSINTCITYPVELRMKLNPLDPGEVYEGSRCKFVYSQEY
jgi:hypothetical protein